jgi:hypothetical protein
MAAVEDAAAVTDAAVDTSVDVADEATGVAAEATRDAVSSGPPE